MTSLKTWSSGLVVVLAVGLVPTTSRAAATMDDLERRIESLERELTDKDAEGMTAVDNKIMSAIDRALGQVEFHGFVDTSYFIAESIDPVTGNGTPQTGGSLSTFSLNQVELRFSASTEWAAMLAEVEFFQNPTNFPNGVNGDTASTDDVNLEQGWIAITPPSLPGFALKLGKFNAPIGLESLDPDARMQVTNSAVFNDLAPFNLTGLLVEYKGERVGIEGFVANGWDVDLDFQRDKTYGARVSAGFGPLGLYFTYIGGKENGATNRHVFDGVVTLEPDLGGDFGIFAGFEINQGWENNTDVDGSDLTWWGLIAKTRLTYDKFGLTLRYDYVHSPDFGSPLAGWGTGMSNVNLISYTVSPSYDITDNMIARLEYRYDDSNGANPFILRDGRRVRDNNTFFAQFIYHW
ncbi:MAG: outer membrane beta-barrel protein [Myxococcales bacterium]|nr:outer membrane beta-barrel protein [Myxococcales bacterium]